VPAPSNPGVGYIGLSIWETLRPEWVGGQQHDSRRQRRTKSMFWERPNGLWHTDEPPRFGRLLRLDG
jgi:hypothetical protein